MKATLVDGEVKNIMYSGMMFLFSICGVYLWKPCLLIALYGDKTILSGFLSKGTKF